MEPARPRICWMRRKKPRPMRDWRKWQNRRGLQMSQRTTTKSENPVQILVGKTLENDGRSLPQKYSQCSWRWCVHIKTTARSWRYINFSGAVFLFNWSFGVFSFGIILEGTFDNQRPIAWKESLKQQTPEELKARLNKPSIDWAHFLRRLFRLEFGEWVDSEIGCEWTEMLPCFWCNKVCQNRVNKIHLEESLWSMISINDTCRLGVYIYIYDGRFNLACKFRQQHVFFPKTIIDFRQVFWNCSYRQIPENEYSSLVIIVHQQLAWIACLIETRTDQMISSMLHLIIRWSNKNRS